MTAPSPMRQALIAALKEHVRLTSTKASEIVGCTKKAAQIGLARLAKSGLAKVERSRGKTGGYPVTVEYVLEPEKIVSRSIQKPKRPVAKTWTPHHVRDELISALFGPPTITEKQ